MKEKQIRVSRQSATRKDFQNVVLIARSHTIGGEGSEAAIRRIKEVTGACSRTEQE